MVQKLNSFFKLKNKKENNIFTLITLPGSIPTDGFKLRGLKCHLSLQVTVHCSPGIYPCIRGAAQTTEVATIQNIFKIMLYF